MRKRDRIRDLSAEFFLIVIGVLAALAVDGWVEERDNARMERDYLQRLSEDVQENISIFRLMLEDWEASQKAAVDLLRVLEVPGSRPSAAGLLAAVARAATTNTGPPQDASFQDVSSTGNLRLITDMGLRTALVRYFGYEIWAGRPSMDRLDLRFRTFAREYLPERWIGESRDLCPSTIPALECTVEDVAPTDLLWLALSQDPSMSRILTAHRNDAAHEVIIIRRWIQQSQEMLEKLEHVRMGNQ